MPISETQFPERRRPSRFALGAGLLLVAAFIVLSMLIPDPILFEWRLAFSATLIGLMLAGAATMFIAGRRRTALVLAAIAMLPLWLALVPALARQRVLTFGDPSSAEIERHFIVGYSDVTTARELALKAHVGGIFLTRRNVAGRSAADVAAEIAGLQAMRRNAGLPPLIVAADQEGGPVSHLSPPLPKPPSLSTLASLPPEFRRRAARQLGNNVGAQLKSLGVTMDLAPVVDLTPAKPPGALDWNTRIASRAISADPAITAEIATGFSEGLLDQNITPTAKHFPGLARVSIDTHLFAASLDTPASVLDSIDWLPFRSVLKLPGAAVMLAHVALSRIDATVPASQSSRVLSRVLRQGWGFTGIAITDDMSMGAVEHAGLCRAVENTLNAGVDLLLVSWDTDKIYPALQCAIDALEAGRLDRDMLKQSADRLDKFEAEQTLH